jgi:gliding motility-associated-like protein
MKKILFLLSLLSTFHFRAQTTCETALPFCASGVSGVTFPATTSVTAAQVGPNYGCLFSTPNPAWYYLQISTTGNLDILIQGQIVTPPGPGQDVDFICWGPFPSLAGICNSLTAANTIDCSYSGSFTETLNIPTGIAGEYYLVLITNFANIQQDIIFTQYAGTGSTNCSLLSSNSKICAGSSGSVVAINSGSLTNPTYSLNPGNLTNSTGSFVVTPTVTTTYTVYVIGINNTSVAVTQTAASTVSVFTQPSSIPTVTNTTCTSTLNAFNLGLSFFPASPVPGYTITWASIPNGIFSPTQDTCKGGILPGIYTASITAAGGCSTTTSFTIDPIPDPAIINLSPSNSVFTITCLQPTVVITSLDAASNYTWSNGLGAPITGSVVELTNLSLGNWTIIAVNATSGCTAIKTFTLGINVTVPTSVFGPTLQNITCTLTSVSVVTAQASPTINCTQLIYSPQGGTFVTNSSNLSYLPGGVGVYTYCVINDFNGCSTCKTFTVSSNQGFPTFQVVSPQNYTLGCNSKSVATIQIINASATNSLQIPTGGAVTYTLLGPPTSSSIPSGLLSTISNYTVNVPGTWTVITKDNVSFCETRTPISILSNTFAPNISALVPRTILDCFVPRITLTGQSETSNVSYSWGFPGTPGNISGDTISVSIRSATPTNSGVASYTLTITDNSSTCKSFSVIPISQNIYPPKALITNGGTASLSCKTNTITLTNSSTTGIPLASIFSTVLPVVGYIWDGPSPQEQGQVSSTYLAATVGVYTLTAKDLNNGCITKTTTVIGDDRIYPILNKPFAPPAFTLDCGANSRTITPDISNQSSAFAYTWIAVPGATISGENTATLTTNTIGEYKVLTTNTVNGCSSSGVVTVVNGKLNASFSVDKDKGFAPLTINLTNNSASSDTVNGRMGISSYWNFANGTTSTTTSYSALISSHYNQAGTYEITLYAVKGNCRDTVSLKIYLELPSELIVPNVFTPNGDNVNDVFFVKSSNLSEMSILIFDRWGHEVYSVTTNKGNISWDGKNLSGKEVADGSYFYTLTATGADGKEYDKNGTISLIR